MKSKLSNDIEDFMKLDSTEKFLESAKSFIEIIEDKTLSLPEFLKLAHTALISLYSRGLDLNQIELKYSNNNDSFDDGLNFVNRNSGILTQLKEEALYWEVVDPIYSDGDKNSSLGSLVDDFADIYQDLKSELQKIDEIGTDHAVEDAMWQLKFSFRTHWGSHAINALRYLHFYAESKQSRVIRRSMQPGQILMIRIHLFNDSILWKKKKSSYLIFQ